MENKKNQSLVIPVIIICVCLFAFGIPFLFSMGVDDSRDDVVLLPRFTASPTPLDRILTQQAFADLFFTPTVPQILVDSTIPTPTSGSFFAIIPITGPTLTYTPTVTRTPTLTRTQISVFPTRTQSGGGGIAASATPTKLPPSTNTAIVIATITSTPVVPDPPTETPVPPPTDPPPTDPPPTDPPPTDPPPTDPPIVP